MTAKPTVEVVAGGIATALKTANIRALPYGSDTFTPPGQPAGATLAPGVALVTIGTVEYRVTFGASGSDRFCLYHWTVDVLYDRTNDRAAWASVQDAMSPDSTTSVRAALELTDATGQPTLAGVVQYAKVLKAGPPRALNFTPTGGVTIPYLLVPFDLDTYV